MNALEQCGDDSPICCVEQRRDFYFPSRCHGSLPFESGHELSDGSGFLFHHEPIMASR